MLPTERALRWTQRRLIWLLLGAYLLGAFAPTLGLRLRSMHVGSAHALGHAGALSLPMLLLGTLLVTAGLNARVREIGDVLRRPALLAVALAANALYPIVYAGVAAALLVAWHNGDEAQNILVGIALIGAMPIAGASTAWSQNADGNLALSLGLVWGSTLLSPLSTPVGLYVVSFVTHGDYSEDLHQLARQGASLFVVLAVVLPSMFGIVVQILLGQRRLERAKSALKLSNLCVLLLLNYVNAASSLPLVVARPDLDFLALLFAMTAVMCVGGFAIGWWIPRWFSATRGDQTAAMFGVGMNNNGAGLVLAVAALPEHPLVLVAIIFYNMVQQVVAAIVDKVRRRFVGVLERGRRAQAVSSE